MVQAERIAILPLHRLINSSIYLMKPMKLLRFLYFELENICRMITLMIFVAFNRSDGVIMKIMTSYSDGKVS